MLLIFISNKVTFIDKGLKMNYELLSKLAMEETKELKDETSLLRKRNEILRNEVERLNSMIKKLQEEKASLENEVTSLKGALQFKDKTKYDIPNYS
jgi:predicted nuclease with TOPRIM domain